MYVAPDGARDLLIREAIDIKTLRGFPNSLQLPFAYCLLPTVSKSLRRAIVRRP